MGDKEQYGGDKEQYGGDKEQASDDVEGHGFTPPAAPPAQYDT